jgi:microcystin-dependent protein
MSDPFLGEIRMFAGNFAPLGWSFCNGALLSIADNNALFALLGTTYGGDGVSTFALPDLRGRVPLHSGNSGGSTYVLGQNGGNENVTLLANQLGSHTHTMSASSKTGTLTKAANGNTLSATGPQDVTPAVFQPFNSGATQVALAPQTLTAFGQGGPHENMQPYLCVSFIIALAGVFPSQN